MSGCSGCGHEYSIWVVHVVQVFVSSAYDVLEMSVVRGMRGVSGVCMCLAPVGVGGERVRG